MDGKRSRVDRLVSNDNLALFIHQDEIRDTDGSKMLRKRVQPKVVRQYGIADRATRVSALMFAYTKARSDLHMTCNPLIESTSSKTTHQRSLANCTLHKVRGPSRVDGQCRANLHPVRSCEMLLTIDSLLVKGVELGVCADVELLAARSRSLRSKLGVIDGLAHKFSRRWRHDGRFHW